MINILGTLAGLMTTVAFVPQVWKTWRTREVGGIDPAMYIIFTLGVGLWFAYGIVMNALPIIIFNAVTFVLALAQLVMIAAYRKRPAAAQAPSAPARKQHGEGLSFPAAPVTGAR